VSKPKQTKGERIWQQILSSHRWSSWT
jgi:hypothetical protein